MDSRYLAELWTVDIYYNLAEQAVDSRYLAELWTVDIYYNLAEQAVDSRSFECSQCLYSACNCSIT